MTTTKQLPCDWCTEPATRIYLYDEGDAHCESHDRAMGDPDRTGPERAAARRRARRINNEPPKKAGRNAGR